MPPKSKQALAPSAGQTRLSFGFSKPKAPATISDPAQKENVAENVSERLESRVGSDEISKNSKKRTQE